MLFRTTNRTEEDACTILEKKWNKYRNIAWFCASPIFS